MGWAGGSGGGDPSPHSHSGPRLLLSMASLSTGASEPFTETQIEEEKRVEHGRFLLGLAQKSTTHVPIPPLRTQSCGYTKVPGRLGNVMLCFPEARRNSLLEKCLAISRKVRKGSWLGKGKLEIGESGTV